MGGLVNRKKNHSYGDITHCRLRAVFFTLVTFSNEDSLACLTYVYIGVISEDPWYSYLLPILLQWISHNLFLYDLRLSQTKIESQSPIYEAKTINWQNKASLACLYRYLYDYKISQRLKQHTLNIHQQLTTRQQKPAHSLREQQRTRNCRQRWLHFY